MPLKHQLPKPLQKQPLSEEPSPEPPTTTAATEALSAKGELPGPAADAEKTA